MYTRAKQLSEPKNSRQRMWRYLSTDRLLEILNRQALYFRRVSKFEDKLEGQLTARSDLKLFNWFVERGSTPVVAQEEVRAYRRHCEAFFASCWHMREHESYLMWRAYADKGVAIATTFQRMQAALSDSLGSVCGGEIAYIDFEREHTALGQVFTHVTTKDIPYSDEREFRLLLWQPDPLNSSLSLSGDGVSVSVDAKMLIQQVVFNPFLPIYPGELVSNLEALEIPFQYSRVQARYAD